jgi:hypothetical protein
MEVAEAVEGKTDLAVPTHEEISAFFELTRSCEGMWTAFSQDKKAARRFAARDKTNSVNAGAIPKRNRPFLFLRKRMQGRGMVGRDWRRNEVGKREASGYKETAWNREQKESS